MAEILIAENLSFDPSQAATQRHAWIAGSGGGKTYGVGRFVEQLFAAECPSLIFDTVGVWPSIRVAADGKSPGLPFVVFGGDHADVPIDLARGRELARVLVAKNASAVIDVSGYLPRQRAPFAADFFEELLLSVQQYRRPRMLVVDEMQDVAPERGRSNEDRMLQAVAQLARKGRNYSLGTCQVTQRPQDVAKVVLNQVEALFVGVLRTKHERQAIQEWIAFKSNDPAVLEKLADLPTFQPGEFLFYSPSWLKRLERIRVLPKLTFDGSSTNPLDANVKLGKLAPVDVGALRKLLAPEPEPDQVVEHSAANGTSAEHAELVVEIDQLHSGMAWLQEQLDQARRENEELRFELTSTLEELQARSNAASRRLRAEADELAGLGGYAEAARAVLGTRPDRPALPPPAPPGPDAYLERRERKLEPDRKFPEPPAKAKPASKKPPVAVDGFELDAYSETLLAAIKAYGPITRKQLALVTGVSLISSTFSTSLGKLHADQWIRTADGKLVVGDEAETVSVGEPRLARGRAVREFWRTSRLDAYKCKLLDAVLAQRGAISRKELAQAAGVSQVSSTFSTSLGQMKRAGILAYPLGKVALSPEARWALLG